MATYEITAPLHEPGGSRREDASSHDAELVLTTNGTGISQNIAAALLRILHPNQVILASEISIRPQ